MEKAIKEFFVERKTSWLKQKIKASMSDEEKAAKRKECEKKFNLENWLPDAAKRAGQLTMASHPCKFSHPSAKTSAVIAVAEKKADGFFRTGNTDVDIDVFGNAAALDVYKFLSLKGDDGVELLTHIENANEDLKKMLAIRSASFEKIQACFLSIKKNKERPVTSGRVKQVYFPVNDGYHLLSVLTPSGLMYELRNRIDDIRFSDRTKEARELKKKGSYSDAGFDYLMNLTMIGYGGAKPQNISVLNNQNGGKACLLLSIPPSFANRIIRLPKYNFFKESLWMNRFKEFFHGIGDLLLIDHKNISIRDAGNRLVGIIIDRILDQVWIIRQHKSGWSQSHTYSKLPLHHKIWLDSFYEKERETTDIWIDKIIKEISRWIVFSYNKTLKNKGKTLRNDEFKHILSLTKQYKEGLR